MESNKCSLHLLETVYANTAMHKVFFHWPFPSSNSSFFSSYFCWNLNPPPPPPLPLPLPLPFLVFRFFYSISYLPFFLPSSAETFISSLFPSSSILTLPFLHIYLSFLLFLWLASCVCLCTCVCMVVWILTSTFLVNGRVFVSGEWLDVFSLFKKVVLV